MTNYMNVLFLLVTQLLPHLIRAFIFVKQSPLCSNPVVLIQPGTGTTSNEDDTNTNTSDSDDNINVIIPSIVHHPVLSQVYPSLVKHQKQYGNPNIPLGSTEGKACKTLRRLYIQNKLSIDEVQLLEDMKFRLRDLEEIYNE